MYLFFSFEHPDKHVEIIPSDIARVFKITDEDADDLLDELAAMGAIK